MDLQPHRTRYWRTARLDARFKDRAEKVLWCYGNAERLARRGIWVVCADEMPNFQVLERQPDPAGRPRLDRAAGVRVHPARDGQPAGVPGRPHRADGGRRPGARRTPTHYIPALRAFRRRHRRLRGVFLIHDGDPSHTAGATASYLAGCRGWWRPRFTPAHASWLNQAELLIERLRRPLPEARARGGAGRSSSSIVMASWPEYNRLYAHPFEWTWTNQKMRRWFAEHAALNFLHYFVPGTLVLLNLLILGRTVIPGRIPGLSSVTRLTTGGRIHRAFLPPLKLELGNVNVRALQTEGDVRKLAKQLLLPAVLADIGSSLGEKTWEALQRDCHSVEGAGAEHVRRSEAAVHVGYGPELQESSRCKGQAIAGGKDRQAITGTAGNHVRQGLPFWRRLARMGS